MSPTVDLAQEQVDTTAVHLQESGIRDVAVLETLADLPDLEYGRGELPDEVVIVCQKCDDEIGDGEMMGAAFGSFYHDGCVPDVSEGPLPLAQYLAGVTDGTRGPEVRR
ncbi:hypothetical protein [Natrinema pallidum]|uniref:Uncharacterized protein n=1 Tax=Natrinema pallidum DSM 3751 TaxID=1227495 RepID=L9YGN6_9EURY|nr:hypothetical protein [Natrinema pallidum]ELY73259.1 hypothetical protein C487_17695 [Natrinema pallidum DSM 3751]